MSTGGDALARKAAARRRAELVSSLRRIGAAKGGAGTAGSSEPNGAPAPAERCELCSTTIPDEHRHMIHLDERRILCVCDACWSLRSDDPELRPAGVRTLWLDDLKIPDDLWARFEIPIGLAFFLRNGADDRVVALYPSPAGATESEIDPDAWNEAVDANPQLRRLEPDAEALIVNRLTEPHRNVIAPIDECYRLVGMIKLSWEGISGGEGPERAVDAFFTHLREREVAG
jgi:hypothetical protein